MNTTLDCETFKEFSTINDAANHTQLFMECPELCTVAFGTGNPDLGGIGVRLRNISSPYSLRRANANHPLRP